MMLELFEFRLNGGSQFVEARFSQFEDTSPMTAPLLAEPGHLAETSAADSILNGT